MLIPRVLVEKQLLDVGGLLLDTDRASSGSWPLFASRLPELELVLQFEETPQGDFTSIRFAAANCRLREALVRSGGTGFEDGFFCIESEADLRRFLNAFARIAADPNTRNWPFEDDRFDPQLDIGLTESECSVRQRRGQTLYRKRLEDLWDNACAVTGVRLPEALRASHAKPWKDCTTGTERLSPFNGFLLTANLDALFDKFLITFTDAGAMLVSNKIDPADYEGLGIRTGMALRFVRPEHLPFLRHHRTRFEELEKAS